jgi:drug/metabolite transporter (DMT)-like permease
VSDPVRRVSPVDLMLLGTILLWALNITVTRYMVTHGWKPLAYGAIRYAAATMLFWGFTYRRERSFRFAVGDRWLVAVAAALIFLNQLGFVYSVKLTNASTVALILGVTPIFVGIAASVVGFERLTGAFWIAAALSFAGVALVAAESGGDLSADLAGDLVAVGTAASWGLYSLAIAPLMRSYSPFRISAVVLALGWVPLAALSVPQLLDQDFHFGPLVWAGFGYAVIGPLFLTNILWFTALDRVGPSRAALFANLQPFFAVLFALLLLSEHMTALQIAGGCAIFAGILLERRAHARELANVGVE